MPAYHTFPYEKRDFQNFIFLSVCSRTPRNVTFLQIWYGKFTYGPYFSSNSLLKMSGCFEEELYLVTFSKKFTFPSTTKYVILGSYIVLDLTAAKLMAHSKFKTFAWKITT